MEAHPSKREYERDAADGRTMRPSPSLTGGYARAL
jgi:hypothetical protein